MKRILVAVDLGASASVIVSEAVQLACSMHAKIRLLHVVAVTPQVPPPGVFVPPASFYVQEFVRCAEDALRSLDESVPEALRDGTCVEIGNASERVCDVARTYDADVVVIGAHAYGRLARALGTTAARVVNKIDRPVFVVRPLPPEHVVSSDVDPLAAAPP